jgi:hypothetical protein
VRWVNTIAGPHRGSEAADLAGTLSGSWLTGWLVDLVGQSNDSTSNCRTDWMAYYNQYYLKGTAGRPPLPRTMYTIAGTGLWNDLAHGEDYGLATLSGVAGMPGEDDGMVSQYSAEGVGVVWFRTTANHHPQPPQRLQDDRRLAGLGFLGGAMKTTRPACSRRSSSPACLSPPRTAAARSPRERPTSRRPSDAPERVSRAYVRTVPLARDSAPIEVPSLGSARLLVWTVASGDAPASPALRRPAGARSPRVPPARPTGTVRRIAVDTTELGLGLPGAQEAIESPRGRGRRLRDRAPPRPAKGALTIVVAEPDSALTLAAHAGPLPRTDQPVALVATLRDGSEAVTGAARGSRGSRPPPAAPAPRSCSWTTGRPRATGARTTESTAARSRARSSPGFWSVRFDAEGEYRSRGAFARTTSSGS